VIALFDKYKVLSPRELHGRYEIYLEQYIKTVNVEANLTREDRRDDDPPRGADLSEALADNVIAGQGRRVSRPTPPRSRR
jgi:glutamine synthetase